MDTSKYKGLFVEEASKNLQEMGESLDRLAGSPHEKEAIDALFRHAHSIKGMAASMGYDDISALSHKTEDLMEKVRNGKKEFTKNVFGLLFEVVDTLQTLVDMVASDSMDFPDCSSLIEKILAEGKIEAGTLSASLPVPPPVSRTGGFHEESAQEGQPGGSSDRGWKLFKIHVLVSSDAPSPAARAFLLIVELENLGTVKRTHPPREEIESGRSGMENDFWLFLVSQAEREAVENIVQSSVELENFTIEEVLITRSQEKTKETREEFTREKDKKKTTVPLPAYRKPASVKVDTPDLDNLVDIIGEMMVQERRLFDLLKETGSTELKNCHAELQRSIKRLHNQIMKLRMMPLAALIDMLPRAIRELQRGTGKEVDLKILGKNVRLDRAILEELGDPLLHLVRNSVDHGIESPEERKKIGKAPCGKLELTAWKEKDLAYIQIEDDGRGIDAKKVVEKAVEKGIISREKAESLSGQEALMLICAPGLSTADKVTDISGRGVGMDVVKTAIENMGGNIFIHSVPGRGTKFILKLPMTLAVAKTFLVRQGELLLAIPLSKLQFVAEVPLSSIKEENGKQFFIRRDERINIMELGSLLNLPPGSTNGRAYEPVVCVEIAGRKLGLVVDHLLTGMEAVIKPLGLPLSRLGFYSGVIVTGKGEMGLVLDLERFSGEMER
ncbi:MAG: chemotaxis protein CheA [Nitrospinae bacterium]|nr:chemotaxis protein CheA [Nitrospinota bacterium]